MDKPSLSREEVNRIIAEKVMGYEMKSWGNAGMVLTCTKTGSPKPGFRPSSDLGSFNESFRAVSADLRDKCVRRWFAGTGPNDCPFNSKAKDEVVAWELAPIEDKARALAEALSTKGEEE